MGFIRRHSVFFPILFLMSLLSGCRNYAPQDTYIQALQRNDLTVAESLLDTQISGLTQRENTDHSQLLLERGTVALIENKPADACADFRTALEALDYSNQADFSESVNQLLLQDNWAAFTGEDFEQILARVYLALALLQEEDTSNAIALLRQAETLQQEKLASYRESPLYCGVKLVENSLAKYLLAALLEKKGDLSNARMLYSQASCLCGIEEPFSDPARSTLLILVHNGNAPFKISGIADAAIASTTALEYLLASHNIKPALSCLTGFPVPVLIQSEMSLPQCFQCQIDGQAIAAFPIFDVATTAAAQLEQKMPLIVARAVARYLLRRGAVAYAKEQSPGFGTLVDLAMLVANSQTTADTRSWRTLPSCFDLIRADLNPGPHQFSLSGEGFNYSVSLTLPPKMLSIVHVFLLHPGVIHFVFPPATQPIIKEISCAQF